MQPWQHTMSKKTNQRGIAAMEYLANGWTPQATADKLNCRREVLYRYLQTWKEALGARTIPHLIGLAITHRLIEAPTAQVPTMPAHST